MAVEEKCDVCDRLCAAKKRRLSKTDICHLLFDEVNSTREYEAEPSIHVLNDECMDLVLSYFNTIEHYRLGLVCKRWYNLCKSNICRINHLSVTQLRKDLLSANEHHIAISGGNGAHPTIGCQEEIVERKGKTAEISVSDFMSLLFMNCGALTTASLIGVDDHSHDAYTILGILADMPNLRALELGENLYMNQDLCEMMTKKIIPRLETLSLYAESVPDKQCFRKMLSNAKILKFLGLKESSDARLTRSGAGMLEVLPPTIPLTSCSFHGFVNLRPKSLEYILRNYSDTLEYLNLSDTNLEGLTNMVTRDLPTLKRMKVFLASVNHHEQLVDWEIPETLCSRQLVAVLKLMPNLRVLDLSENHYLTGKDINIVRLLAEYCPLLEELHLTKCAIPSGQLINLKKLRFLKRLYLGNISNYTSCYGAERSSPDDWVQSFKLVTHQVVPHLKELQYLSLQVDTWHDFPTDDVVSLCDHASPNIKTLSFSALFETMPAGSTERHDLIENFAKKCKENCQDRDSVVKLLVHGMALAHSRSCDSRESGENCSCHDLKFDEIAPEFLQISSLVVDEKFDHTIYYPDNISQNGKIRVDNRYVKLPRLTAGHF